MPCNQHTRHSNGTASRLPIAEYLTQQIVALDRVISPEEIGKRIGYERRNIIPKFMSGAVKVPLDMVLPLARVLGVPFPPLFRMGLEQFGERMIEVAAELFDRPATTAGCPGSGSTNPYLPYSRLVSEPVRW